MIGRELAPAASVQLSRTSAWQRAVAHPLTTTFVLALLVRLANLALLRGDDAFFAEPDTIGYWQLGARLANPEDFKATLSTMTERMPLAPLLIGAVQLTVGEIPRAVALVQAVIDAGTCVLIAALGRLVSPLVGLVAGVLAALSVTMIVYSSQIATETLFLFFFTLMLLAGGHFVRRPTNRLALVAGLAGGLSLVTRPAVGILLVAAIPLVFVIAKVHKRSFLEASAATMLFAFAAVAPVAPVLLRNAIRYDTLSLTPQTGDHLAFWIVPLVTQRADGTPYQTTVERMQALYQLRREQRGLPEYPHPDPFRHAKLKTELAFEEMARLPLSAFAKAWLEGMVVNLGAPALIADPRVRALPKPSFYGTPGASLWERARAYLFDDPGRYQVLLVVGLLAMLPILLLELVGFVMLARTLPWAAVLAAGVLGYFLMLNGPVATAKYRLPMEPVLIVLAGIPLAWLARRYCRLPSAA